MGEKRRGKAKRKHKIPGAKRGNKKTLRDVGARDVTSEYGLVQWGHPRAGSIIRP